MLIVSVRLAADTGSFLSSFATALFAPSKARKVESGMGPNRKFAEKIEKTNGGLEQQTPMPKKHPVLDSLAANIGKLIAFQDTSV